MNVGKLGDLPGAEEVPFGTYKGTFMMVAKGHVVKVPDWPGYFYCVVTKLTGSKVKLDAIEVGPLPSCSLTLSSLSSRCP